MMRLDDEDEDSRDGLKIVSGTHGMDVPSACTIVIIAGNLNGSQALSNFPGTLSRRDHCLLSVPLY